MGKRFIDKQVARLGRHGLKHARIPHSLVRQAFNHTIPGTLRGHAPAAPCAVRKLRQKHPANPVC
jgi:hypothetical protein